LCVPAHKAAAIAEALGSASYLQIETHAQLKLAPAHVIVRDACGVMAQRGYLDDDGRVLWITHDGFRIFSQAPALPVDVLWRAPALPLAKLNS
jgi:hypothetical protein